MTTIDEEHVVVDPRAKQEEEGGDCVEEMAGKEGQATGNGSGGEWRVSGQMWSLQLERRAAMASEGTREGQMAFFRESLARLMLLPPHREEDRMTRNGLPTRTDQWDGAMLGSWLTVDSLDMFTLFTASRSTTGLRGPGLRNVLSAPAVHDVSVYSSVPRCIVLAPSWMRTRGHHMAYPVGLRRMWRQSIHRQGLFGLRWRASRRVGTLGRGARTKGNDPPMTRTVSSCERDGRESR
jgi:hypothetical protein